ncbi:hypothetical protein V6N12_024426 [Hibiscus sabdariffa]|uniref:Uncharacterized protein n=1 Tax=Hibiscus sabdariffa TaxID=183260 RepID=A0ABR2G0R4_9ROSI
MTKHREVTPTQKLSRPTNNGPPIKYDDNKGQELTHNGKRRRSIKGVATLVKVLKKDFQWFYPKQLRASMELRWKDRWVWVREIQRERGVLATDGRKGM